MAHDFEISAQTAKTLGSVKHWRDMVNGTQNCTDCQSSSISVLPAQTMRLKVSLKAVKELLVGAAIYLFIYACCAVFLQSLFIRACCIDVNNKH